MNFNKYMKSISFKLKDSFYDKNKHPYFVLKNVIRKYIDSHSVVLDAGCGHDAPLLRSVAHICPASIGIDICNLKKEKPDDNCIHLFKGDLSNLALRDNSIDIVISRSVLEHIKEPEKVYKEVHRVLRPHGHFIFLTPNLYDYASIFSKLIPNRFHSKIVKMTEGRDEKDTFPTYYRTNTKRSIEDMAKSAGFKVNNISMLGQYPSYLMFNPLLFLLGTIYDKIICRFEGLDFLRGWILCVLEKPLDHFS